MKREQDKTAIIYCRVSSHEQVQGTSLAIQENLCKDYAEREGLEVLRVFIEEGESAKTVNRPELQKSLLFCADKKNRVDQFVVYKLDRFSRNQDDHGMIRMTLKKYGTKLRSVTEQIDESPVGRLVEGMLANIAEFDNSIRAQRCKGGMEERVKQGVWVWNAPLGYKRLVKGGNLVIDETMAPYIRMTFEEWSKGTYSYRKLSDHLYERGFRAKSGKKIYQQGIERIIKNHIYYGQIVGLDMEVKGSFEPIISEQLFFSCQPAKHRKVALTRREALNPRFPLKRFVKCAHCAESLTGSSSTGRSGVKYPYYHHHKQECKYGQSIKKAVLEEEFVKYLSKISPQHLKYEKLFKQIVLDVWQTNYKRLDADNARIRAEIASLEADRQRIFDAHRSGTYDDLEFLEQKGYINGKIREKKLMLSEKQIEELNMEQALEYCFNFVRNSGNTWKSFEKLPELRLRFQNLVFPKKLSFDGEKFGTTTLSLVYSLKETFDADSSSLVDPTGFEPAASSVQMRRSTK
jgi:site-specific DNA recombinase